MTLQYLIDQLEYLKAQGFSPETPVHFAYNSGDHWGTKLAPEVVEVTTGTLQYSDYHQEFSLFDMDEEEYDDEEEYPDPGDVRIIIK